MKTNSMKQLLPLAAIILVAAGCDPFPPKPGGDPRVVRVTTADQTGTGNSVTVENTGTTAGTVSNDGAFPRDTIYVQFNKPMNGSSFQFYKAVDANGNPFTPPIDPASVGVLPTFPAGVPYDVCRPATNLTLTGFTDGPPVIDPNSDPTSTSYQADHASDHLQRTTTCYNPGAPSDGGQLVVTPGAPLVAGTVYKIAGNVQDYQGKTVTLDITITVVPTTFAMTTDGYQNWGNAFTYAYSMAIDWFPSAGATAYTVQRTATDPAGTTPPVWTDIVTDAAPADVCDDVFSGFCEVWHTNATPSPVPPPVTTPPTPYTPSTYWYRVLAGTAALGDPVSGDILPPIKVALDDFPVPPAVADHGKIKLNWARAYDLQANFPITPIPTPPPFDFGGAVEYLIERAPNVVGVSPAPDSPGTFAEVQRWPAKNPYDPATQKALHDAWVARQWIDTGLTTGTKYWYRVTPVYGTAGGPAATVPGTAVSHVSK
jgi:hypothetical protein